MRRPENILACARIVSGSRRQKELCMTKLCDVLVHMRAGRWDDAHNLVQSDDSLLGAWLHGILHIQEGDLEDAEYWYDKANRNFRHRGTLDEELQRFAAALQDGDSFSSSADHTNSPGDDCSGRAV
jgi:hypothetical protein